MNEEWREAQNEEFRNLLTILKTFYRFHRVYRRQKFIYYKSNLYAKVYKLYFRLTNKSNHKLFSITMAEYDKYFAMEPEYQERKLEHQLAMEKFNKQLAYIQYLKMQL